VQSSLTKKIAGEVVLSDDPGSVLRKWREEFKISQLDMARHLRISPSVISDYESGRRSSPGSKTIRRLVEAMLEIDQSSGRRFSRRFEEPFSEVIPSIRELPAGASICLACSAITGSEGPACARPGSRRWHHSPA